MQENQTNDKKFVDEHVSLAFSSCFYGEIRIKFEHGRVVHVKKEQCFKPRGEKHG